MKAQAESAPAAAPRPARACAADAATPALRATARHGPLFIVLNAGSGRHDAKDTQSTLSRVFGKAGRAHEFHLIADPSRIGEVAAAAVRAARARGGVVVAAGGDGTLSAVGHAVLGHDCPFAVLPQGTFNYFGRDHGIPQDIEAAARGLLEAGLEATQVGVVNDRAFLVNASLGLYPQLLEDREAWKSQLGRSRIVAMASALRTLLRERRQLDLRIESRNGSRTLRTPTLFVGNNRLQLDRLGFGEASDLGRGRLAAILVKPIGNLAMLGLALRGAIGQLGDAENLTSFDFQRITVHPRGHRRIKVAMDGEVTWMRTPLVFAVAKEPLWLLVPPAALRAEVA